MSLTGKVVIVTGGSRGIGRACVLKAASLGARVVFCSRTNQVESTDTCLGIAADVSKEADVIRLFETGRRHFGAVHGVVCNAATIRDDLLVSTTTDEWDAVVDTNLTGGFLVVREAVRTFLEQKSAGRIVAIGSLSQNGVSGNASYSASKGGVEGLAHEVSRQYPEIAFNIVVPGYVETQLSSSMSETSRRALIDGCPMRRPGSPEEIASVVTHLLATDVGGQTIYATGGLREVPL
jgi:3-oxoacyl-[acyl-carrier protein] reductase